MELAYARRLRVDPERITAHCGRHIVALNRRGWIEPASDGYYFNHTRFLSRFELRSGDGKVKPASCANVEPHATVAYFLVPSPAGPEAAPPGDDQDPTGGEIVAKGIEVQINAFVGGGWRQDVYVTNRALVEATVALGFLFDADFASWQEVSSGERKQSAEVCRSFVASAAGLGELTLAYQHPKLNHATRIRIEAPGPLADDGACVCVTLRLARQESARIAIDVAPVFLGEAIEPWFGLDGAPTGRNEAVADGGHGWRAAWISSLTILG